MKKNSIYLPIILSIGFSGCNPLQKTSEQDPPNILWVSIEDLSTWFGCYGDPNAITPNVDAFAERSIRFTNAYATHPVCAPARSCIITGINAITLGSQHLRAKNPIPDFIKPFPKYLRESGYYASNNSKEDYNFEYAHMDIWNESSGTAHWRNKSESQPFFSVFNLMPTHQSWIFGDDTQYADRICSFLPYIDQTLPESVILPPYYPDTPEIRILWARYYTNVSIIDYQFGQILQELEEDGLTENTVVVFFSDHGTGVPRGKRSLYDEGLRVPLLVHIPEKYLKNTGLKMGTVDDRMVTFADFAPAMLELAGIDIPDYLQGQPFLPGKSAEPASYAFGASDRVDEAHEMARTVRTREYRYIRNFLPHLPLIQANHYSDQSEILRELRSLKGKPFITPAQSVLYASRRTVEELYDIGNDPHETVNLAYNPDYEHVIKEMRKILRSEIIKHHDTGLMPEPDKIRLSLGSTPYKLARDPEVFPIEEILDVCDLMLEPVISEEIILSKLRHPNGFIRYWTLIAIQDKEMKSEALNREVARLLDDSFTGVQLEAAKVLIKMGDKSALKVVENHLVKGENYNAVYAARTFQDISHLVESRPMVIYDYYKNLEKELAREKAFKTIHAAYWALAYVFDKDRYYSTLLW